MLDFPLWKKLTISGICLFFILFSIPSLLSEETRSSLPSWMSNYTINLGLDLQGGSHLLLRVEFEDYKKEQLDNLVSDIRATLREEGIGYRGLGVEDGAVAFTLRDRSKADYVQNAIEKQINHIDITENNAGDYSIRFNEAWQRQEKQRVLTQSLEIINRRINETGTKEPLIARQGEDRILVQVPGEADPARVKALLGKTAKMTFHLLDESVSAEDMAMGIAPGGVSIVPGDGSRADESGRPTTYPIIDKVELSGDLLVDANTSYDPDTGEPVVAFRFNNVGARKFAKITKDNLHKPFAIILDGKVITAPVIQSPILSGSGIISGNFTTQTANELAILLRAGALPTPLTVIEERSVGPSLGQDSIEAGSLAAAISVVLVVVFMWVFYGLFGLFANIAMIISTFMIIALLAMLGATLTLPGIAGIVLTIGMAVDANVLIYERMREEMKSGRSVLASIEHGFKMAYGTIIDSNITTLFAALILFSFGSGTVKGFAVTLAIGIICSLFTCMLVTRMLVASWALKKRPTTLPI